MKLTVQTLGHNKVVLATLDIPPSETYTERSYIDAAIEVARNLLADPAFPGKNVRVADELDRTIWMTYYGLVK